MKASINSTNYNKFKGDIIALPIFKEEKFPKGKTFDKISKLIKNKKFKADFQQVKVIETENDMNATLAILVGLGKKSNFTSERARVFAGHAYSTAKSEKTENLGLALELIENISFDDVSAISEGLELSDYNFQGYKSKKDTSSVKSVELLTKKSTDNSNALSRGKILGKNTNLARELINQPANVKIPDYIAKQALSEFKKVANTKVTIFNEKQAHKMGMGGLLAIGESSDSPPRLAIVEYKPKKFKKTICIVGKGVTFDTGGINTKPFNYMKDMKQDMSGAAAVFGALKSVAELNFPIHAYALMPLAENMVNGKAVKHGDVVKAFNGKTIEIVHSDAEGRVILSDALSYASKKIKPDYMIDLATLTGAAMTAVGPDYTALMTKNEEMSERLLKASEESGELLWRLPFTKRHNKRVESEVADVRNLSKGEDGQSGASTAAAFLEAFVDVKKWAHLDIAATAFYNKPLDEQPYFSPGGTGAGVRVVSRFIENLSKEL